jgi:hypothetical protein
MQCHVYYHAEHFTWSVSTQARLCYDCKINRYRCAEVDLHYDTVYTTTETG